MTASLLQRTTWVLLAISVYTCAYGIARWRKFVVMTEYYVKENGLAVRRTQPGFDIRENWRGHFKNELNRPAFLLFRPLELLEDRVRGGTRHLTSNQQASLERQASASAGTF